MILEFGVISKCGNIICEAKEIFENCPRDCPYLAPTTLNPTDDAYFTEGSTYSTGGSVMIEVNNQGGGYETRGAMRFDLSSISLI